MKRRVNTLMAVIALAGVSLVGLAVGCGALSDAQQKQIHDASSQIMICQIRGLNCRDLTDAGVVGGDAGCYAIYDECMRDGGLRQ